MRLYSTDPGRRQRLGLSLKGRSAVYPSVVPSGTRGSCARRQLALGATACRVSCTVGILARDFSRSWLAAEKFIADPFQTLGRLYRTRRSRAVLGFDQ